MREQPPESATRPDHPPCLVCQRRRTGERVCSSCRDIMAEQVGYLLPAWGRLPLALIPARGGGERVRTSRTAPLPTSLEPLSMTADGRTDVYDAFVPATRARVERVVVPVFDPVDELNAKGEPTGRRIPCYVDRVQDVVQRLPVLNEHGRRVLVPAGDQAGVLPVPVWTRAWALDWRGEFGHSIPPEPELRLRPPVPPPAPRVGAGWVRTPFARAMLGRYLVAVRDAARRELVRDVLGQDHVARVAKPPPGVPPDPGGPDPDPQAREWAVRWGRANEHLALAADVKYLTTWLLHACDEHPDIGLFAAALKALHRAVQHALGDGDDKAYLGRCPTGYVHHGRAVGRELLDRESGERVVCGFPLFHDPHTTVIGCARCGEETDPRRYMLLAGHIRRAWPVDLRRRYTVDEADDIVRASVGQPTELRMPTCEVCGRRVVVSWRDATERGDGQRMWRIAGVTCPAGCSADAAEPERMSA